MAITIGTFTCNYLTAQPYGYEGEARTGLTARTFRVSGLLTKAQWQALISEYNTWRGTRINDQDTLLSEAVGTTISLTVGSANGISITGLACWFVEAPQGEQAGPYIQATAVLVDAAQALAVLLRQRELEKEQQLADAEDPVDCTVIAANLQRQKDETDCELAALTGGLADDFAEQQITREVLTKTAEAAPYAANVATLAGLDGARELVAKTAELAVYETNAAALAALDGDRELAAKTAELPVFEANAAALAVLDGDREIAAKTAELAVFETNAAALAALDGDREIAARTAELPVYEANAAALVDLDFQRELATKTAEGAAYGTYSADLATLDIAREVAAKGAELTAYTPQAAALAEIDSDREVVAKAAELTAYTANAAALAVTDSSRELVSKTQELAAYTTNADDLAALDADRGLIASQAELTALGTRAADQADITVARDLLVRGAEITARAPFAEDLAELDLQQELQSQEGKAAVYATYAEDLATAGVAIEIADLTARQAVFAGGGMESLKTLRSFQALIDKYLSEDLPDLGTESLGGMSIKLTKPATGRAVGPSVTMTAGGFSLVQGPLTALQSKSIEGYVTGGTIGDLMSWYDGAIGSASAGSWFPTRPPTVTNAESVLVAGVKTTRYTVSAEIALLV